MHLNKNVEFLVLKFGFNWASWARACASSAFGPKLCSPHCCCFAWSGVLINPSIELPQVSRIKNDETRLASALARVIAFLIFPFRRGSAGVDDFGVQGNGVFFVVLFK